MDTVMQAGCQAHVHHVVIVMGCGSRDVVTEAEIASSGTSYHHRLWVEGYSHGD